MKINFLYHALSYKLLRILSHDKNLKTDIQISEAIDQEIYDDNIPQIYLKHISKYLDYSNKSIIDIGCGTGDFAISLAKTGAKKVIGIDIDSRQIDLAKKKAAIEHVDSNTSFICADFNTYHTNELFDIAFSLSAFEHIPSPLTTLRQIYNCLNPGGILLTIFGPLWYSPHGAHMWGFTNIPWVHFLFPEKVVLKVRKEYFRPDDPVDRYEDVRGHLNRITVKDFIYISNQAGFKMHTIRLNPSQDHGKYKLVNAIINRINLFRELFSFQMLAVLKKQ